MKNELYIGIDLGGTFIKTVLLDQAFKVINQKSFDTDDSITGSDVWKRTIVDHIKAVQKLNPQAAIRIGIAAPGLANEHNDMIRYMPGRLQGLENLNWSEFIGIPSSVLNDAHAACVGEWKKGAGQGKQNVLMVTLGTGVGGAAILDGKLYQGMHGRAGHFGHMTINYYGPTSSTKMVGSLEASIGNLTVAERTSSQYLSTRALVEAYNMGDKKATHWWLESVNKLACALSSLVNAFSPEIMILGGGITNAGDALFKPLEEFMTMYEWCPGDQVTPIHKAHLGDYAGAIGAAIFTTSKQNI